MESRRLAKPHLVRQQHSFGERRSEREQRRVDLVGIEVDLGIHQSRGQPVHAVGRSPAGELMGPELGMVGGHRGQFSEVECEKSEGIRSLRHLCPSAALASLSASSVAVI